MKKNFQQPREKKKTFLLTSLKTIIIISNEHAIFHGYCVSASRLSMFNALNIDVDFIVHSFRNVCHICHVDKFAYSSHRPCR